MLKTLLATVSLVLLVSTPGWADDVDDLLQLIRLPGISGHETAVRDFIELRLPPWARPRADDLGNLVIRIGNTGPHTLIVAPLDEGGLVVSAITDEGYLRVHRHTVAPGPRLSTQYLIGQPVQIVKADGMRVDGVVATPSTHLRAFSPAEEVARIKSLDDVWVDVGATSRAEVEQRGVRVLDPVTLRERAVRLAGSRVAGSAASARAATLALDRLIARFAERPVVQGRQISLAWIGQSQYNNRGLLRLLETLAPDHVIVLRSTPAPANDARGGVGLLGAGPVIADDDADLAAVARQAGVAVQTVSSARLGVTVPERWKSVRIHAVSVPALFSQTPVETVDARDVGGLSSLLDSVAGFAGGRPTTAAGASTLEVPAADADGPGDRTDGAAVSNEGLDRTFRTLSTLIETYGVSGHEAPVREAITKLLPAWARPQVDARGNLTVSFGSGGRPLVFVAHMDEVGFEITAIEEDGSARVRTRGGMYLSLYEAHPVVVQTPRGHVAGVMSPRRDYASAVESQPALDRLAIYFGTGSAAETRALGVDAGQSATIRKAFATLGPDRATGRSMDDRAGCAALILALHQTDPAAVQNPVTFAWVVEEETGLGGASFMAGGGMKVHTAFAVDTFVATDTPVDVQRVGAARLGQGAVLRGLDSRTLVRPEVIDRIVGLAREASIPLQIGMTSGGTDASAFSASGAIDAGLSWPGKYSHSPVEVLDRRDLDNLVKLIVTLARSY